MYAYGGTRDGGSYAARGEHRYRYDGGGHRGRIAPHGSRESGGTESFTYVGDDEGRRDHGGYGGYDGGQQGHIPAWRDDRAGGEHEPWPRGMRVLTHEDGYTATVGFYTPRGDG